MTALVVDTSAACAVLFDEPERHHVVAALAGADDRLISAATCVELAIVVEARHGPRAATVSDRFVREAGLDVVDVTATHAARATEAWRRWGKGRHPAGLNLGDVFTYATAVLHGCPVLCVGGDFTLTDVEVVPLPA